MCLYVLICIVKLCLHLLVCSEIRGQTVSTAGTVSFSFGKTSWKVLAAWEKTYLYMRTMMKTMSAKMEAPTPTPTWASRGKVDRPWVSYSTLPKEKFRFPMRTCVQQKSHMNQGVSSTSPCISDHVFSNKSNCSLLPLSKVLIWSC